MPAEIDVAESQPGTFEVCIREGGDVTRHEVSVSPAELERYAPAAEAAQLVDESFRFLLEREPRESILPRFEIGAIERYFPEFPREIARRLDARSEP